MKTSVFTGERFVPGIEDEILTIEHMQRYYSVCQLVENKKVLDAACGEGYGSRILADSAAEVTGLDISGETVERAKKNYGDKKNLRFQEGSIASLPFEDSTFDVIVSFETIEHVNEELQNAFLKEARRVLKEDGIFVISTPNKKIYSDLHNYHNEFHVKEFYVDEFVNFLKRSFSNIKLFNQYFEVASIIDGEERESIYAQYYRSGEYEGEGKYVIAIASDTQLDDLRIRSISIGKRTSYLDSIDRILTLQKEEEERNQHIKFLDGEISERDKNVIRLQRELEEKTLECGEIGKKISAKDTDIATLQNELEDKNLKYSEIKEEYSNYRKSIEKRVEKVFSILEQDIGNKNEIISDLKHKADSLQDDLVKQENENRELEKRFIDCTELNQKIEKDASHRIKVLEAELQNRDAHIEQLLETEREYEREKKTRLYKLNQMIRRLFGRFEANK